MPSANNRRNRRMRKQQAEKNSLPAVNNPKKDSGNNRNCNERESSCSGKAPDREGKCSLCNGSKCKNNYTYIGSCGCKFGECCFDATYIHDCPICKSKTMPIVEAPQPLGSFNDRMVQGGEIAAELMEELASKASNAMASWSENTAYRNRPHQPMSQQQRDQVIREVRIANVVAETAAVVTGHIANGVGSFLWTLGSALAPVVRTVATEILKSNDVGTLRAETIVDNAMKTGTAAILTTANVARGVQRGTGILASGVCSSMARIYETNHGFQPGELHSDVGNIAANIAATTWNVKALRSGSKLTKVAKIAENSARQVKY